MLGPLCFLLILSVVNGLDGLRQQAESPTMVFDKYQKIKTAILRKTGMIAHTSLRQESHTVPIGQRGWLTGYVYSTIDCNGSADMVFAYRTGVCANTPIAAQYRSFMVTCHDNQAIVTHYSLADCSKGAEMGHSGSNLTDCRVIDPALSSLMNQVKLTCSEELVLDDMYHLDE